MNSRNCLLLPLLILSMVSCGQDRTAELADYLKAEKRLRDTVRDSAALADSVAALAEDSGIKIDQEISRLSTNPSAWVKLLRSLRHE